MGSTFAHEDRKPGFNPRDRKIQGCPEDALEWCCSVFGPFLDGRLMNLWDIDKSSRLSLSAFFKGMLVTKIWTVLMLLGFVN